MMITVINVKLSLCSPWRRRREWRFSSTYLLPGHFMEVSGQLHAPAGLPMMKASAGTHWMWGWAGSSFGWEALEKW